MTSNVLFETDVSFKKKFWLGQESNANPHACQFAALTARPSGKEFSQILKTI